MNFKERIREEIKIETGSFVFLFLMGLLLWILGIAIVTCKANNIPTWVTALSIGIILLLTEIAYYGQVKHQWFGKMLSEECGGLIGLKALLIIFVPVWIFMVVMCFVILIGLVYGLVELVKWIAKYPVELSWTIGIILIVVAYFTLNYFWGKKLQEEKK